MSSSQALEDLELNGFAYQLQTLKLELFSTCIFVCTIKAKANELASYDYMNSVETGYG